MADTKSHGQRPLSPHLMIYRPMFTMMMSIMHRITGCALYFGTLVLAWWLIAAAAGEDYFNFVNGLIGTILGKLMLFGFTLALMLHIFGGIRHFIWDTGRGFGLQTIEFMAWGSAIASFGLTVLIWFLAYLAGGVF